MYVHIGQDYIIPTHSVVTIFDMDTATNAKSTRNFIARLEREGRVISLFDDLPKSAILCTSALGEMLYISQISTATLWRRIEQGIKSL